MAFLRRAERMLAHGQCVRIDHSILVATLSAQREAARAAAVPARPVLPPTRDMVEDPLVELLLAGPLWRYALCAQRGCFSRAEAGRRINAS